MEQTPKWFDPCGMGSRVAWTIDPKNITNENATAIDKDYVGKIIQQVDVAESRGSLLAEKVATGFFNMNVAHIHAFYADQDYEFLPTHSMSKKWKQPVPKEYLETLKLEPTLLSVFTDLQKIAVGLEQVMVDEKARGEKSLYPEYLECYDHLHLVLCEVHSAILEKGLKLPEHVQRDVMQPFLRHQTNQTDMFTRNWIIYRDYMNMLEYVQTVFRHFNAKLEAILTEKKST